MYIIIIYLSCLLTFQNDFYANVIGVSDGDTITVLTDDNKQIKIRLDGIDCPESRQDFGNKAKKTISDLIFNRRVLIKPSGKDSYGRMLAYVFINEISINKKLIELGMAWHYKKYNKDYELAQLEVNAREKKVGLWGHPNPIAPWDFRKVKKVPLPSE